MLGKFKLFHSRDLFGGLLLVKWKRKEFSRCSGFGLQYSESITRQYSRIVGHNCYFFLKKNPKNLHPNIQKSGADRGSRIV